ncbi:MAG: TIGR01212 family radical SAM protein [Butyrivibrio sp.]|uniref:TIGR01212 family radical SAM protein n=1 Tax=Butyrivibrio sp. TaxID=28121 RepID=UPI001B72A9C6|nr:TIGR01212 family radical SAM protein [Butyrivibrio sp.]MBP3783373.1 TIGR01212 family radical SAM protein [Butyrivibrio sp.]MBP3814183.1 TIGR01212 family radical SAM protein [Butyrivibrio sp.]
MSRKAMLLNEYLRERFGCKVYKIALNGGFTCPNRDGKLGTRGCIFCSEGGSGEFAESARLSITKQIELGKEKVAGKIKDGKYIAYFQAYTGTYDKVERLRALFTEAIEHPDIVVLSVATRPDCLPEEVLDLLEELNRKKPVWVELGLQTIHEESARYIRRGYELPVYDKAVKDLRARGIEVITHLIIGLPGETRQDILESVRYVCRSGASGIKLQLLHILKGTDLEKEYQEGLIEVLSEDEYIEILKECVDIIPENVIIHRLTGDGDKKILLAPMWSANKKHVWNKIQKYVL